MHVPEMSSNSQNEQVNHRKGSVSCSESQAGCELQSDAVTRQVDLE